MSDKTKRKKKIRNTRINERKYLVYPLHKMVKEFTGIGDLDILKAELSEELARQTRTHRLDMISKWGQLEIEEGTIQAEHLLEIMRDLMDQLHEKERAMRRSDITERINE